MQTFLQDVRYGIRMLSKSRGVTAVAVVALALGIGANTAIFSGVNAFVFRPLPVPEPDQLVRLAETADGGTTDSFSYLDYADYRDQNSVFEGLVGEDMVQAAINSENQNDVIWGQVVTGNYFDVLRVKPLLGRTFAPNEDQTAGEQAVVVIGHSLWQRRFGSDPNIVGRIINLNNRPYNVIGVAPEEFKGSKFGLALDFWAPMMMVEELQRSPGLLRSRNDQWMTMLARLKPGVSREQAAADMSAIALRLNQSYPNERASSTKVIVRTEVEGRFDDAAAMMKSAGAIAMAIVGFVLMIACANVANLLLARAAVRRKEIGIRVALGASRSRLIRQLLTESLLLAVLGGGFGLLLAYWITGLLQGFMPILPYNLVTDFFAIDRTALVFSLVVSVATGFIFGLAPALAASKAEIVPVLKGDSNASSSGRVRRFTLRNTLVVTQMALSLVVLVCGGLFIKSFRNAQSIDPGFNGTGVLLVSINPQLIGYDKDQTRNAHRQILERVSGLPGVQASSFARLVQLGDSSNANGPVLKEGETLAPGSAGRVIKTNWVSPGHFKTLQIPFLAGRDFDERERTGGPRAIVVNERMAQVLWPGESAVGKRITIGTENREPIEVIGVVKTGKYRNLGEEPQPFFFFPMSQRAPSGMTLMVRTDGDPRSLIGLIRKEVEAIDRRLPLAAIKTMKEHMSYALWGPNMAAMLSLAFGVVALSLAAVGLYSVMAYMVTQRTREVGIRMALGARRADVLKMITLQGMKLAAVGIVAGFALSIALTRVLSSVLIGVDGYDIATFIAVPFLLTAVALVACFIPARRATKVDPLVALRYE